MAHQRCCRSTPSIESFETDICNTARTDDETRYQRDKIHTPMYNVKGIPQAETLADTLNAHLPPRTLRLAYRSVCPSTARFRAMIPRHQLSFSLEPFHVMPLHSGEHPEPAELTLEAACERLRPHDLSGARGPRWLLASRSAELQALRRPRHSAEFAPRVAWACSRRVAALL